MLKTKIFFLLALFVFVCCMFFYLPSFKRSANEREVLFLSLPAEYDILRGLELNIPNQKRNTRQETDHTSIGNQKQNVPLSPDHKIRPDQKQSTPSVDQKQVNPSIADQKQVNLPIADQKQVNLPIADKKQLDPPIANPKQEAPQTVDQKQDVAPIADQAQNDSPVAEQKPKISSPAQQKQTISPAENQKQVASSIADQKQDNPPIPDRKQTIPPAENQKQIDSAQTDQKNSDSLIAKKKLKPLILLYHKLHGAVNWWFTTTDKDFEHCIHKCQVTSDKARYKEADMVMFENPRFIKKQEKDALYLEYFRDWGDWPSVRGNSEQVRVFFAREPQTSGLSGEGLNFARFMFNYTVTFQQSADLFYPYGHAEKLAKPNDGALRDYARSKSRLVLWIVSNCNARARMMYKQKLDKHIQVDMIGACNLTHGDPCKRDYRCTANLKNQYKFYLAFENSQCEDYITEKFWKALNEGMVPIALGPNRTSYERVAPPHSFIHVNDFSDPQKLAEYLLVLDKNNTLYNKYHEWRRTHAIRWEYANCELCRMATEKPMRTRDITRVWNAHTQCHG